MKWFIENILGYPVVGDDQAALITKPEGFELLLPPYKNDEQIPVNTQFLTALYLRAYEDPEWVEEMIGWWTGKVEGTLGYEVHTGFDNDLVDDETNELDE